MGIDEVSSLPSDPAKIETTLKKSMSDGDDVDDLWTARGTKASEASMCGMARASVQSRTRRLLCRRGDTAAFWEMEGNGILVSLFYSDAPTHADSKRL